MSEHLRRLFAHVPTLDCRGTAHIIDGLNYRQATARAEKRSFVALARIVLRSGDDALAGLRPNQRHGINGPVRPKRLKKAVDLWIVFDWKPEDHVGRRLAQPIEVVPQSLAKPIEHLGSIIVVPVNRGRALAELVGPNAPGKINVEEIEARPVICRSPQLKSTVRIVSSCVGSNSASASLVSRSSRRARILRFADMVGAAHICLSPPTCA